MRVAVVSWDLTSNMGLALLNSVVRVCGRLKRGRPPQQVINHRLGLFLKLGESFVQVTALEMRPKSRDGNVDGRAHRSDLNLDHGFSELLNAARAHGAAVADERSRLAVPLRIHPIDRIFQHRGGAVVVFRRDKYKTIR